VEKLKKILNDVKARVLSLLSSFGDIISLAIKAIILVVAVTFSFLIGARKYETGGFGVVRGSTVSVSGICNLDGEPRFPALAEDQVKVTSVDEDGFAGVVRRTREHVVCLNKDVAVDSLPLLKDFTKTPEDIPVLAVVEKDPVKDEVMSLVKKTLMITGSCKDQAGTVEVFTDKIVDVVNANKDKQSGEYVIYGIRKDNNSAIRCGFNSIKYSIPTPDQLVEKVSPVIATEDATNSVRELRDTDSERNEDLRGQTILVSSTCFPDPKLAKLKKDDVLFYPLVNALVQVLDYKKDSKGNLENLTGVFIKRNAMIVCDSKKYPIVFKKYDPSKHELININQKEVKVAE